jgi:hypothetical protein
MYWPGRLVDGAMEERAFVVKQCEVRAMQAEKASSEFSF